MTKFIGDAKLRQSQEERAEGEERLTKNSVSRI
jgi:hypothetical protein